MTLSDAQLIHGDCLDVLPTLPAGSVDAIITDLPYGTTACAWDTVIPFESMWEAVKHVLKQKGAFVTTASQPFTSALVMSNPKWFKYEWIWKKNSGSNFANLGFQPFKEHENIVVFCNGVIKAYNPQMILRSESSLKRDPIGKSRFKKAGQDVQHYKAISEHSSFVSGDGMRNPSSVLFIDDSKQPSKKYKHPTQKPVALYEYLIRTYTNAGEIVLDMCMGSGTTGVAAIQTGRKFIGIEKDAKYFEIAQRRISEAHPPLITDALFQQAQAATL